LQWINLIHIQKPSEFCFHSPSRDSRFTRKRNGPIIGQLMEVSSKDETSEPLTLTAKARASKRRSALMASLLLASSLSGCGEQRQFACKMNALPTCCP
jgi:SET domain-containing protein